MGTADLTEAAIPASSVRRIGVGTLAAGGALLLMALVVALHMGLVGAGQWEGDEYYNFNQLRALGGFYFGHRLLHWAARPISEALIFAYSWVVQVSGRPLIGEFLAILWALLIGAALAHVVRSDRARLLPRLLLGTALLAMFLLGHTVAEVFYWPMGAAAYLPTLSGLAYVTIAVLDGRLATRPGRAGIAAALTLAAGCSELGAMIAAVFLPALLVLDRFRPRPLGWGRLPVGWMLVPFGASLAVLAMTAHGRAASNLALVADSATLHHLWPSLRAAAIDGATEFVSIAPGDASSAGLLAGAVMRVSLFLGFRWCVRRGGFPAIPSAHLLALIVALPAASLMSLIAGYDLFGFRCCLRHDTFRGCAYVLVLLALAGLSATWRAEWFVDRAEWTGPAALVLAVLLALGDRGSALAAAWRTYPDTIEAKEATWRDAARPGAEFEFRDQPAPLTGQLAWPAGRFTRGAPAAPWYVSEMIRFFGKQAVRIAPPREDAAAAH